VAVQYTVDNNAVVPTLSVVANAFMPCGSTSTVTLNASTTATNVTYAWTGPNIVSGSTTANPVVDLPGTYSVTLTNTITGCISTATVLVINSVPTASFVPDVTSGFAPLTVTFTNTSVGATSGYSWSFGDGNSSTSVNPQNIFTNPGSYTVSLIAYSGTCSDTLTKVIMVDAGFSIEIPNVFTPNNDGTNDFFTIKSTGVKELTLQIYNRWGQKMYEFTGAKAAWDGVSANGTKVSEGTYFYFVKAIGYDDTVYEKQGPVTLFR
jgi:gliding motility-associated-like protein